MSLIIAGERSGCGKTTVTLMLLAALRQTRGQSVQSFKVGPDYIDPMFHRYVTGRPCYNLDPVLTSPAAVQQCFARYSTAEYGLIEGVMGLFDGRPAQGSEAGPSPAGSTADVAKLLEQPVALVIDCSRLSGSVAAIAQGYGSLDPEVQLAGVILNRVGSDRHLQALKSALVPLGLPILGVLRRHSEITLPDRHLGLVPTDELPELDAVVTRLAEIGLESFDWERLLALLQAPTLSDPLPRQEKSQSQPGRDGARVAVARDRAFSFYYAENLELLEHFGAELRFWSPLNETLPPDVTHLYLGGGFPEMFAEQLSANGEALAAVRGAIAQGLPTYAECGGLMYLCEALQDFEGRRWPMAGVLPTVAVMAGLRLGYRRAIAQQNTPLLRAGQEVWGHEFHHSHLTTTPAKPLYQLWGSDLGGAGQREGWTAEHLPPANLHASYVHLHWGAQPEIPQRFLRLRTKP